MSISTIGVDEFRDIALGEDGNVKLLRGDEAVLQDVSQAMRKVRGENPFNTSEGVDYFGVAFTSNPDYDQLRSQLIDAAQNSAGVASVVELQLSRSGDNIDFTAKIKSKSGENLEVG